MKEDAPEDLACFPLLQEENEHECTSSFLVSDLRTTAKDVGSYVGGKTYFGSDTKEEYKLELQPSQEPRKEEEDKATSPGCEAENLVEEKATLVSLREDGNVKNMVDKGSDFCSYLIHGILKTLHLPMRTAE